MRRYYFHIRLGEQVIADQDGADFADIAAVRREALTAARDILADAIRSGSENIPEAFVIADSEGREVETLLFAEVLPDCLKRVRLVDPLPASACLNAFLFGRGP